MTRNSLFFPQKFPHRGIAVVLIRLSFRHLSEMTAAGTEVAIISCAMRIAIPIWSERVSPVFDVARTVRVVDISDGKVSRETIHTLEKERRASKLVKLGVDIVICAAISTPLEATLWMSGIEVIPDTCGTVEEIVDAFASGDTKLARFRSPGNNRRHRSLSETSSHHRFHLRVSR